MRLLDEAEDGGAGARWRLGLRLSGVMAAASAAYGAVLGSWHGPYLALLVAVKLPLVLLATSALTVLFAWMVARLFSVPLSLGRTAVLGFRALTVAGLLMASFVGSVYEPVAFLRRDALDGNVYEFIVTDIVPHLSGRSGKESR